MDKLDFGESIASLAGIEALEADQQHFDVLLRCQGNPHLYDKYKSIEAEADIWIRGEGVSREDLAAIATKETEGIIARTYRHFMEDADTARTYVSRKYDFDDHGNLSVGPSDYETNLRSAFAYECGEYGLAADDPELEHAMQETALISSAELLHDFQKRVDAFVAVVESSRAPNPAVFEELVRQAALESMDAVDEAILALPSRPDEETRLQKAGRIAGYAVRRQLVSEKADVDLHDEQLKHALIKWKQPQPERLIREYIRNVFVQAAKEAFGDSGQPIRLNVGAASDSIDLYDARQAEQLATGEAEAITLPNMPSDYLKQQVYRKIENVLHGKSRLTGAVEKKIAAQPPRTVD